MQPGRILQVRSAAGVFFLMETEGVCANCVAGKQHHDCLSVSPDVEALSWLSVPGPSLVSLCVSRAASQCCLLPPSDFFPRIHAAQYRNQ